MMEDERETAIEKVSTIPITTGGVPKSLRKKWRCWVWACCNRNHYNNGFFPRFDYSTSGSFYLLGLCAENRVNFSCCFFFAKYTAPEHLLFYMSASRHSFIACK
jgi:hypothetical protein